jgi:hypothetical protein
LTGANVGLEVVALGVTRAGAGAGASRCELDELDEDELDDSLQDSDILARTIKTMQAPIPMPTYVVMLSSSSISEADMQ